MAMPEPAFACHEADAGGACAAQRTPHIHSLNYLVNTCHSQSGDLQMGTHERARTMLGPKEWERHCSSLTPSSSNQHLEDHCPEEGGLRAVPLPVHVHGYSSQD